MIPNIESCVRAQNAGLRIGMRDNSFIETVLNKYDHFESNTDRNAACSNGNRPPPQQQTTNNTAILYCMYFIVPVVVTLK